MNLDLKDWRRYLKWVERSNAKARELVLERSKIASRKAIAGYDE